MEISRLLKRCLSALFVSLSLAACQKPAAPAREVRVLFVGNSLTYMNDLPGVTAGLAKARNIKMDYVMHAPGGATLAQHAADARLSASINKGNWDFVVLQEQSQLPAFPWAQTEVYPYAQKLSQAIRAANPRAQVAFYMTMARRNGDQQNVRDFPGVATYDGMQRKLNESYTKMAADNQGLLVPVGQAWQNVRAHKPALDLYSDDVHPNPAGTYLAACVFYSALFKDSPSGLPHPREIDDETAEYLQKEAAETMPTAAK